MLRTPSACAPSSSDSSAIRFRSRVVQWTRHSRSRSCWIPNATANAPIRTLAIAELETLTASTPASWRRRAASIVRSIRTDRGGSISTDTTNRRAASSSASRVGGGAPAVPSRAARSASAARGCDGAISRVVAAAVHGPGADRVERRPHRGDVLGRRPAAPADDPCPGLDHPRRDLREVVRRRPRRRNGPRAAVAGRHSA